MIFKTLTNLALLAGSASAAGGQYDYKQQGADWKNLKDIGNNECGGSNQSPIDLPLQLPYNKLVDWEDDHMSKLYNNIENAEVKWTSQTSKVNYPKDGDNYREANVFQNWHNWDYRKTAHEWEAAQFHWHGPSEHTVEGRRFDLELHIVHFPSYKRTVIEKEDNGGYIAGVLGIFFDSSSMVLENAEDYEIEASNELFESMFWDETNDKGGIKELKIGDFLNVVDAKTRWTYRGSLTTPPCSTSIQWNVVHRVYPVQKKYVEQWNKQMSREKSHNLKEYGNYRETQETTAKHDVHFISKIDNEVDLTGAFVIFIILAIVFMGLTGVFYMQAKAAKAQADKAGANELAEYDTNKTEDLAKPNNA